MDATWPAMGSTAHVVVHGGDEAGLVAAARQHLGELEAAWSRFRPTSEVSRINRGSGAPVRVGAATRLVVTLAQQAHRLTGGWFDAVVATELVAWGYDRTFTRVRPLDAPPVPGPEVDGGITVDHGRGTVMVPAGRGFDPGGIGKGLAADLVCRELLAAGAAGACVNVGGDLRVGGRAPARDGWLVGRDRQDPAVDGPGGERHLAVPVRAGGLATSSAGGRSWKVGDERVGHLLDPHSRRPLPGRGPATTVVASSAWRAEVLATAAVVRGGDDVVDWVARRGGRVVRWASAAGRHGRGVA